MKRLRTLLTVCSLLTLGLFSHVGALQALPAQELAENYEIRVVVPEDRYDDVELLYLKNGEEIVAHPQEGEIVSISIQDGELNSLDIPFSATQDADEFEFVLGEPEGDNLGPVIGFQSTLEATGFDEASTLVLVAPEASVKLVQAGDIEAEILLEPGPDYLVDETTQEFVKPGVLKMKFFASAVEEEADEEGMGEGPAEPEQEPGAEGGEGIVPPPGPGASGGCNLLSGTSGASGSLFTMILLACSALLGLRKKIS